MYTSVTEGVFRTIQVEYVMLFCFTSKSLIEIERQKDNKTKHISNNFSHEKECCLQGWNCGKEAIK